MELEILKLLNEEKLEKNKMFLDNIESTLKMNIRENQIVSNEEWLDQVEFSIPYIEKALGKPNKNIVTEEEIIKVELIKKVSIESIKHLSKNTNLITKYDKDTGDVIPSKILNAYKEESFITYENRFIYSLIKLIEDFIYLRKKAAEEESYSGKKYKKASFSGKSRGKREKVAFNFEYIAEKIEESDREGNVTERIKKVQEELKMLKTTEMYKLLDSKRIILVKSPLKMTNVLLKNVNFQYAVKLWNYLSDQMELQEKSITAGKDEIEVNGRLKNLVNENFFLEYLVFLERYEGNKKKNKKAIEDKAIQKELTDQMIEKIIEINPDLTQQQVNKMITDRYIFLKNKNIISLKPVEDKFKKKFNKYIEKISELRLK